MKLDSKDEVNNWDRIQDLRREILTSPTFNSDSSYKNAVANATAFSKLSLNVLKSQERYCGNTNQSGKSEA
jgi:hypothetical protein